MSSFLLLILLYILLLIDSIKYPEILLVYIAFFFPFTDILLDNSEITISRLMLKFIFIIVAIVINKNSYKHIKINLNRMFKSKFFIGYSLIIISAFVHILFLQGDKSQHINLIRDTIIYNAVPCILFIIYCNNDKILQYINQQILLMIIITIFIVYNYYDSTQFVIGKRMSIGEAGINNIGLSQFATFCFFMSLTETYYNKYRIIRTISLVILIISIFTILLAVERGPIVGIIIALFLYVIYKTKIGKSYKPIIILVNIAIIIYLLNPIRFGILERFSDLENYQSYARYDYIFLSIDLFLKKPFFGYGILGFFSETGYAYPHNIVLEFIVEYGMIGLFALYLMLSECIKVVYKCLKEKNTYDYELAFSLSWIALFVSSLFTGNIVGNRYFYAISGIISAIAVNRKTFNMATNDIMIKE